MTEQELLVLKDRVGYNGKPQQFKYGFDLAIREVQAAQQKEGCVFVKPQLDSDVKAKMIGEYNVPVSSICPDCTGEMTTDTERLDWLIEHHARICRYKAPQIDSYTYVVFIHNEHGQGIKNINGETAREAIDKAIIEVS